VKSFLIHDATGRILRCGVCPDADLEYQARDGETLLEAPMTDGNANYVEAGEIVPRAACPIVATLAGRVVTLSGMPVGAVINIDGEAIESITQSDPSGELEVTLPAAGNYRFACSLFPALSYSQEFVVS